MIDHMGVTVTDIARSKAFYQRALAPLGYELLMDFGVVVGFGVKGKPDFWLAAGANVVPLHVAFTAPLRSVVRAFYDAAIDAGGKDNGGPGVRAQYHPSYYGAFVHDPDGHNVEAVCHEAYLG
jgi:catechol 2,3-dioxygenase-like lactoylglutathione lyase family enzyme